MRILFLDQSGQLGGAELCLLDVARPYRDRCLVGLLSDGAFRARLEQQQIPVEVLTNGTIAVHKASGWLAGLASLRSVLPLVAKVVQLSWHYDLIYANTQKAFVIAALASFLSRRPLVYHLHDILSAAHFSSANRQLIIFLANRFASKVIANSRATRDAFIEAGGRSDLVTVVYNGFDPTCYDPTNHGHEAFALKQQLGLQNYFLVGQFSRLAPWKGQHILLAALTQLPDVAAILVGDALFGEQDYVQQLKTQVEELGLQERVRFLGFRNDVASIMGACDLVVHTSIAPEPFGRVVVEAMLCGKPVVASATGGVVELVEPEVCGWLVPPDRPDQLAAAIADCRDHPETVAVIAQTAKRHAAQRFGLNQVQAQIAELLQHVSSTEYVPTLNQNPL